jgi:hypothetical protein
MIARHTDRFWLMYDPKTVPFLALEIYIALYSDL